MLVTVRESMLIDDLTSSLNSLEDQFFLVTLSRLVSIYLPKQRSEMKV